LSVDAGLRLRPAFRANSVSPVVRDTTIAPQVPFRTFEVRSEASRPASGASAALEASASTAGMSSGRALFAPCALPDEARARVNSTGRTRVH
jgi:hypothetical protein